MGSEDVLVNVALPRGVSTEEGPGSQSRPQSPLTDTPQVHPGLVHEKGMKSLRTQMAATTPALPLPWGRPPASLRSAAASRLQLVARDCPE